MAVESAAGPCACNDIGSQSKEASRAAVAV